MLFANAPIDPSRVPTLEYPNNGVMLPPNLRLLDVHWLPGSPSNTLYRISFSSPQSQITYYTRCGTIGGILTPGSCGFQLDETGFSYLAASNAGAGAVTLNISATDDSGTGVGTSNSFTVQFAQETVNGGVYYWDVSNTRIMRFDFGSASSVPQVFLAPGDYGTGGTCVGCHTLSRDGTKIAASAGGQGNGLLVYVNDIAGLTAPGAKVTVNEDGANRMQFGSFDPLGDLFVGIYGDGSPLDPHSLYFHDGTTGLIVPGLTKQLAFEPDHPAWSPDGTMIAMTHVGGHNTSQMKYLGGIDVASFAAGSVNDGGVTVADGGATLGDPVVVVPNSVKNSTTAINSYNPDFAPDSTFLVFSQTTCAAGRLQHGQVRQRHQQQRVGDDLGREAGRERDAHPPRQRRRPGRRRRGECRRSSTRSRERRRSRRRRERASCSGSRWLRCASRACAGRTTRPATRTSPRRSSSSSGCSPSTRRRSCRGRTAASPRSSCPSRIRRRRITSRSGRRRSSAVRRRRRRPPPPPPGPPPPPPAPK